MAGKARIARRVLAAGSAGEETRELALAAEACGFVSLWSEDHLFYGSRAGDLIGPWDPWTTLAGLAAVIERVRIGTLVSSLAMYGCRTRSTT